MPCQNSLYLHTKHQDETRAESRGKVVEEKRIGFMKTVTVIQKVFQQNWVTD